MDRGGGGRQCGRRMHQLRAMLVLAGLAGLVGCDRTAKLVPDAGTSVDADAEADADTDAAAACDPADAGADRRRAFLDLRVSGSGFEAHEGATVYLYTSQGLLDQIFGSGARTVAGGSFVFDFPGAYHRAEQQMIAWFVDADGDSACSADGPDHTGRLIIGPFDPAGDDRIDVAITDNHMSPVPGASDRCAAATPPLHDLHITGSGFEAHEGQTIHLMTSSPYNGLVRGAGQAPISGGAFSFLFPKGFERTTYQDVFWFVDVDGDGRCTSAADDTGYLSTAAFTPTDPAATVELPITDNHGTQSASAEDVCSVMNGCRPPR